MNLLGLNRTNRILAAVLIVQIVVAVALFIPTVTGGSSQQSSGPLLANFNSDDVVGLVIHDNSNNELDLAKTNGNWVLPKADNYPVTASSVTAFLDKLKALQTNRLIAENPSSQTRLHVAADTYDRLVEIQESGNKVTKLYIGTSGGTNANHMRVDGQNQIYLTSGLAATDASVTASGWITTPYYSVTQDNIVTLTVQNANGTFNFKKVNGAWTLDNVPAGQQFNTSSVTSLLSHVASINLTNPLGLTAQDSYGLKAPLAVITVTTSQTLTPTSQPTIGAQPNVPFAPKTTPTDVPTLATQTVSTTDTLQIGAKQASGDYAFKASTSTYFVDIDATTAEAFTNLKQSDLISPLPSPTPAPTSTPSVF